MKRGLTYVLILTVLLSFTNAAKAEDRWETLRAINWVENPTNHAKRGKFGELGPYQFRPATWRMHTKKSFHLAAQRDAADEVAVKHYEWIKDSLERAGVDANVFNIAMAWNSGVNNVINGRAPNVSYNYAQRVVNLVHTFQRQSEARSADAAVATTSSAVVISPSVARIPSLEEATFDLGVLHNGPKFELALASVEPVAVEQAELVIYTDRAPVAVESSKPIFVFAPTATATINPTLNVLPGFSLN